MKNKFLTLCLAGVLLASCEDYLTPQPVDQLSDQIVISDARGARGALSGLYREFTSLAAANVIAGDFMADNLKHNGTFTQFNELDNKTLSSANGQALATWDQLYLVVYISNFILEKVPELTDLTTAEREQIESQARVLRAYAYFVGVNCFGPLPYTTSSSVANNRSIARSPVTAVLPQIETDLLSALDKLPETTSEASYLLTNGAVKALLARFYLYQGDFVKAEDFANQVITGVGTASYALGSSYEEALEEEGSESILEVFYDNVDNPSTSASFGLWNLFTARREIIPSDEFVSFVQNFGGDREDVLIEFDASSVGDRDNGYTLLKYAENGSNILVIRLAEMYLIRAEARAERSNLAGALADLNTLRSNRGFTVNLTISTQDALLQAIANERRAEFAFEGHRWYDLKRTGTATGVLGSLPNWTTTDLLYPIPQNELLYNPIITPADQNPGY